MDKVKEPQDDEKFEVLYTTRPNFHKHILCVKADAYDKLRAENQKLRAALGRIEQLESMPLDDANTVLKKHNVMGSLAREALGELKEMK